MFVRMCVSVGACVRVSVCACECVLSVSVCVCSAAKIDLPLVHGIQCRPVAVRSGRPAMLLVPGVNNSS